jgi:nucleoside-diphosphate-sugar epimerase
VNILVTGAAGFVGRAVCRTLAAQEGDSVMGTTRQNKSALLGNVPLLSVGPISGETNWLDVLRSVNVVIHLASRAHVLDDKSREPLKVFRQVNVNGTLALARQALSSGVKRFIFISSIGVNGAYSPSGAFSELSVEAPCTDYALSKFEAEEGLLELVKGTEMELVIIRPPLVYAGHAPGNFNRLLKLVSLGVPLPFAALSNQRSMIALEHLTDLIALCVRHPAAANQTFLVSDGVDLSIAEIISFVASGMGKNVPLFSVPKSLMRYGALLLGQQSTYRQLCEPLVIDSSKSRSTLGWKPEHAPAALLFRAGQEFWIRHRA